jgi:ribosomal-protein-alanine N-acetyltransferase
MIETDRLLLRRFVEADLDALAVVHADADTMRYLGGIKTRAQTKAWLQQKLARYGEPGTGVLAVIDKATGRLIGQCGLVPQLVDGEPQIEIGYTLASTVWRRGYASEAAAALRDHGFGVLGLSRMISLIPADHVASIGVARKIGLRFVRECEYDGRKDIHFYST